MPKIDTMHRSEKLQGAMSRRSVTRSSRGQASHAIHYLRHEVALDMLLNLLRKQLREDARTTEVPIIQW